MSTLYIVATPIGNLEDISQRALRVLRDVSLIAAEDTRRTRALLKHFQIDTRVTSYFDHNKQYKTEYVLSTLVEGDVALVSDSGTPVINDPGYELVLEAIEAGHKISPIPGPCAPVAALVCSGLPSDSFLYLGYLPRRSGERQAMLKSVNDLPYTLIFLEAPHRLISSLGDLVHELGNRQVSIGRELTKLHEEIYRGMLSDALVHFSEQAPRGEFTLVVEGKTNPVEGWSRDKLVAELKEHLERGGTVSQIARQVSTESGWSRRDVYGLLLQMTSE